MANNSKPVSAVEVRDLENQAISLFNAQKYKEAIALYKQLLLSSNNPVWQQQLADCYLRRAEGFGVKSMYKEALVLWENYRQHAQPPYEYFDHYLVWLIQSDNSAAIQSSLEQLTAQQLDKNYPELAAVLGTLILTHHPEFQPVLPQDSVFIAHLKIVQSALQAYKQNDLASVDQALQQLPYRSAFRDFRTVLKAGLLIARAPAEACVLLGKIPANSPYSQAARLLLASTLKGSELAIELAQFSHAQRKLVTDGICLNKQQIELIEYLCKQKQPWPDKFKFNLAIQYQSLFGSELAQCFCFSLLTSYPAGQRDFEKAFNSIDEFEQNRLKALSCEEKDNSYDAYYYWKQCIKALLKQGDDNDLKIALIYRHIAKCQPDPVLKIQHLCSSLEHDPTDRDSYLQILSRYRQQADSSDFYKEWLNKALAQFPDDIEVLMLASQAAKSDKADKKAIEFAEKILETDPINSFAKQQVFSSHLNHARQLLKTQKYDLAAQEIQQAENLKLGKTYALQADLLSGLLSFANNGKPHGLQLITQALNQLNPDPATAHFQATMEAMLAGLPVAPILRELPQSKDELVSAPALTRLIQLIDQYAQNEDDHSLIHKALDKIKAPLKKSLARQNYTENLQLSFCQTLDAIQHFELMRPCAKSGQTQWQKPLWFYYKVYAETNGDATKCTFMQRAGLQLNLEDAYHDKDFRAQTLIGQYLDAYHEQPLPNDFEYSEQASDLEEFENFVDPIYVLFGHLPDDLFDKIDLKADVIARKTSPDRLISELIKISGPQPNLLSAMQKDPDLFTALLLLKAANDLKLDIEVTTQSILDFFGLNHSTDS